MEGWHRFWCWSESCPLPPAAGIQCLIPGSVVWVPGVGVGASGQQLWGWWCFIPTYSGAKETAVSHQEPHKVQLDARMSCFCLCFAMGSSSASSKLHFPQLNTSFFQLHTSRVGEKKKKKLPVFLCMPQTCNIFKESMWKFIMWYLSPCLSSYLDHDIFDSKTILTILGSVEPSTECHT